MNTLKSAVAQICSIIAFPLALTKGLGDLELNDDEAKVVNKDLIEYIWQSNFSKSFLVWRRRLLYSSSMFLLIGSVLQGYKIANQCGGFLGDGKSKDEVSNPDQAYSTDFSTSSSEDGTEVTQFTMLGKIGLISQRVSPFVSVLFLIVSAWTWSKYIRSRNVLLIGWFVALFFMVWPNLMPVQYLIKATTFQENALLGAAYSIGTLPLYLALIKGISLGSHRVYSFAPSPLTGAMVVMSATFSIIIPFAALTLIVQLLGNIFLIIGMYLIIAGPIVILINSARFTTMATFASDASVKRTQLIVQVSAWLNTIGLLVILSWCISKLVWAINYTDTSDAELSMIAAFIVKIIPYDNIIGKVFEFIGNMTFQAVLWTDIIVHISRNDDLKMIKLQSDLF